MQLLLFCYNLLTRFVFAQKNTLSKLSKKTVTIQNHVERVFKNSVISGETVNTEDIANSSLFKELATVD
jgi:hypothetical protein